MDLVSMPPEKKRVVLAAKALELLVRDATASVVVECLPVKFNVFVVDMADHGRAVEASDQGFEIV